MEEEKKEPVAVEETAMVNSDGDVTTEEVVTTQTPRGRETLVERMRGYDAEADYDDDEVLYGKVSSMLDERDKLGEGSKKLAEIFQSNPRVASFFIDMTEGKGLYESLGRNFGDDLLAAINGDEKVMKELDAGLTEWRDSAAARAKQEQEMSENLAKFQEEFSTWAEEQGYDEAELGDMEAEMIRIAEAMSKGNHMDFARALARSRRYDADVEAARAEGEVRGRNARIAEERTLPKRGGDGLPNMQGTARPDDAPVRRNNKWTEDSFWGD